MDRNRFQKFMTWGATAALLLLLPCCGGGSSVPTGPTPVTLRLVHGPELRAFLSSIREQFGLTNPQLENGSPIKIELISEMGLTAARRLARGDLKVEAWLAPSRSLVDFVNSTRINLGSEQVDCPTIFSTPIILAAKREHAGFARTQAGTVSWNALVAARAGSDTGGQAFVPSLSHPQPHASTTGLASLIQLAYFAAAPKEMTPATLEATEVKQQLKKYQSLVFSYPLSESFLLAKTASATGKRPRFALTSEQQLLHFNQQQADTDDRLEALYPEEGSYVQEYSLCLSNADWVTEGHRTALQLLKDFMLSESAQRDAQRMGFRPATTLPDDKNLPVVSKTLPAVTGDVVSHLLKEWPAIRRPAAVILVLDSSGSMEGDPIAVGKEQFRKLLAQTSASDLKALIAFNSTPQILSAISTETSKVIPALDTVQSLGGSAVYDGIRTALELSSKPELTEYRKLIIVYTDGDDKNSEISLPSLLALTHQAADSYDINLVIVAVDREGAEFSDLERIAETADGAFRRSPLLTMDVVFQEVAKGF